MAWSRIIGQTRVKQTLLHALRADRLPHAYVFSGPEGVGKDAVAMELAKVFHCDKNGEDACDVCPSCRQVNVLQHPDVKLVIPLPRGKDEGNDDGPMDKLSEPDVKAVQEELHLKGSDPYHRIVIQRASVIKVNSIREVRRETPMTTSDSKRRVTIISQADLMNDESSNVLLKTLEEPTGLNMFILTTAHREQLLPTIVSRCQTIRFDQLREEDICDALQQRLHVPPEQAALTARLADGSYTRAVELLAEDLLELRRDIVQFIRHTLSPGVIPMLDDIDRLSDAKDRDLVRRFLLLMLAWFRDAMVLAHGGPVINLDQQEDLNRFVARFADANLPDALAGVERAIALLDRNVLVRLILINLGLHLRATIQGEANTGFPGMLTSMGSL